MDITMKAAYITQVCDPGGITYGELPDPAPGVHDVLVSVAAVHSALTASVGLFNKANIQPGETIFVNGAAGNVGSAVIQLAKHSGAKVIATAGTEEKIEWCRQLGADVVLNYKTDDVTSAILQSAPGGINVHWDTSGKLNIETALPVMARRGRIIIMSGLRAKALLPIGEFYTRNLTLYGFTITYLTTAELSQDATRINSFLRAGALKTKIHSFLP